MMKTRTIVCAWVSIGLWLMATPVMFVILDTSLYISLYLPKSPPSHGVVLKLHVVSGLLVLPFLLVTISWWQLLRRRRWAWWLLTTACAVVLVLLAVGLGFLANHTQNLYAVLAMIWLLLSLVLLLTDRPSNWRAPRTSGQVEG